MRSKEQTRTFKPMQVTETLSDGLKREIKIAVPASDLTSRLDARLDEMKSKVRINGFRPGKVPTGHLRRLVGKSEMAKIIDEVIGESIREAVDSRKERPALNPDVALADTDAEKVIEGEADLVFTASYELLPDFELQDWTGIEVERVIAEIDETEVDEQLNRIAEGSKPFDDKGDGAAIEKGDKATIDFVGKIDGEAFEGGTAEGVDLVIGSGQFIPGFEDQLIGAKAGAECKVEVAFPADYSAAHLAGKAAVFDVTVKSVAAPGELVIDDAFATKLGIESLEKLRQAIRDQIQTRYGSATRAKVKRQLLDKLDVVYQFDLPGKLVTGEFDSIWKQATDEMEKSGKTFADEDTTEEAARADYHKIAERRVRLGLVLSEIGEKHNIQVTDEEVSRAVVDRARQFPGQEREVFEYYKNTPIALATLRAPIYEEKVVDFLLSQVKVTDKTVTKDELFKEDEEA